MNIKKNENLEDIVSSADFVNFCKEYDSLKSDVDSSKVLNTIGINTSKPNKIWLRLSVAGIAAAVACVLLVNFFHTPKIIDNKGAVAVQQVVDTTKPFIVFSSGERVVLDSENAVSDILKLSAKDTMADDSTLADNSVLAEVGAQKIESSVVYTPKGSDYLMSLPDGSKVWLLADSRLTFVSNFADGKREVSLEGEAYFDVFHNEAQPFIVHTNALDIKVLGTEFNVQAYAADNKTVSTLMRGSVKVCGKGTSSSRVLKEGEQATMKVGDDKISVCKVNLCQFFGRREGRLAFRSATLGEVLKYMERWYNLEVKFEDESAKSVVISCDLVRDMNIEVVLAYMEEIGVARFELSGNQLLVKK